MHIVQSLTNLQPQSSPPDKNMVWVSGGSFRMGSDKHYPEEAPLHQATVEGFWIDQYAVTNEQVAAFVAATRHITSAERPPNPAIRA